MQFLLTRIVGGSNSAADNAARLSTLKMMDWSSEDPTSTCADSIYVTPAESDGGVYLDESYDALGRRRATLARNELAPREVHVAAQMAGHPAPRLATHWGRDLATHWNESSANTSANTSASANMHPPSRREKFAGAPERTLGLHMSDKAALTPIYANDYDERPAAYKPKSWAPWSRQLPMAIVPTPMPASAMPASATYNGTPPAWAAPWAGGPSPIVSAQPCDFTRGWAQNIPWRAGPPVSNVQESFAGSMAGGMAGGMAGAISIADLTSQLQLLFLFIIIIILALILRSIERRNCASATPLSARPWSTVD